MLAIAFANELQTWPVQSMGKRVNVSLSLVIGAISVIGIKVNHFYQFVGSIERAAIESTKETKEKCWMFALAPAKLYATLKKMLNNKN